MSEDREKLIKWLFRIYILIVVVVGVGIVAFIIPFDLGQNILHLPTGNLFADNSDFLNLMNQITLVYFIFAIIIAGLGAAVSIGTRDVFEVLALFFAGMLPRERKYWGVVFDQTTKHPLSFVPVRVFKYSEGKGTLLTQTVTDTDGRYRLHIDDQGGDKYTIEIHYPGYQPVVNYIDQYLVIGNYELVSDIPLVKENSTASKLRVWFYYQRPRFFTILFYGIYYIYLLILIGLLILLINDPIFVNFFAAGIFGLTAVWNTNIIRQRRQPPIGKVVDVAAQQPVPKAFVNVYNQEGEAITALTDTEGVVKLNIPSGIYRSLVTAQGYIMLGRDSQGFKIVKVGKDGYIDKDIKMEKHNSPLQQTPAAPAVSVVPAAVPATPPVIPVAPVVGVAPIPVQPSVSTPQAPVNPAPAPVLPPAETKPDASYINPFN